MLHIRNDFSFFGGTLLEKPWQPGGFKSINILWLIPLISALTAVASSIISMRYTKQLTPQGEKVPGQGCSNVMMLGLMPMFSVYCLYRPGRRRYLLDMTPILSPWCRLSSSTTSTTRRRSAPRPRPSMRNAGRGRRRIRNA